MTQPWNPHRRLSDEEYRRLSPGERRALFQARQQWRGERAYQRALGRHEQRYHPRARRSRKRASAWERLGGAFIALAMTTAVLSDDRIGVLQWFKGPVAALTSTAPVRASFGACKWGGGSNCVVDGDTIHLGGVKIRIAGIDAPETHDYGCDSELALGERAADRLQVLLNSGAVTLSGIGRDEDVYGRKLRNVAVDGRDVGDTLIAEGLARAYAGGRRPWC